MIYGTNIKAKLAWVGKNGELEIIPKRLYPSNCILGNVTENTIMYIPEYVTVEGKLAEIVFEDVNNIIESISCSGKRLVKDKSRRYYMLNRNIALIDAEQEVRNIFGIVGELDFDVKTSGGSFVVKLRIFPRDIEEYHQIVEELKTVSHDLLYNSESPVKIADTESQSPITSDIEKSKDTKWKFITRSRDVNTFLDEFEIKLRTLELHAETDLESVYEKTELRKVKRFTPRTIVDAARGASKVTALEYRESFNIYEHRAIRNYLQRLIEECEAASVKCKNEIALKKDAKDLSEQNKVFGDYVLGDNSILSSTYCYTSSLNDGVNKINNNLDNAINKLEDELENWTKCISRIGDIISDCKILNVPCTTEELHSSMLFLRNRYYRDVYEDLKHFMMIKTYVRYEYMPVEKQWKLYEYWCFFRMLKFINEVYGFEIVSCLFNQLSLPKVVEAIKTNNIDEYRSDESKSILGQMILATITDSTSVYDLLNNHYSEKKDNSIANIEDVYDFEYGNNEYIGIVLSKKWTEKTRHYSCSKNKLLFGEDFSYKTELVEDDKVNPEKEGMIILEYQREFSKNKKTIRPDICMTTCFEKKRQLYMFDAKYKHFYHGKDMYNDETFKSAHWLWIREMLNVSWYKYFSFFETEKNTIYRDEIGNMEVKGSFILYPEDFGIKDIKEREVYSTWSVTPPYKTKESSSDSKIVEAKKAEFDKKLKPYDILGDGKYIKKHNENPEHSGGKDRKKTEDIFFHYPSYGWINEYYGRDLGYLVHPFFNPEKDSCAEMKKHLFSIIKLKRKNKENINDGEISEEKLDESYKEICEEYFNELRYKIGLFYYSPKYDYGIKSLFRMILEYHRPFGLGLENQDLDDKVLPILWNNCKICGETVRDEDIMPFFTKSEFLQYAIRCSKCGDVWNKTHCRNCNNRLIIRHHYVHNYLKNKTSDEDQRAGYNYVRCPDCNN